MTVNRLQHLSWEEFHEARQKCGVVIIPVGSVEQHGPHLPLGTDTMVAVSLADAAADQTGAIVAAPLWYGWSPHHMVLPGTVTIRPEVLIELLYDVTASLAEHGVRKFVFLNGHRVVNVAWMQIAAERASRQLGVKTTIFDPAYMSKELVTGLGFGPLGHAEEIESSHMLHVHPELVHIEKAIDYVPPTRNCTVPTPVTRTIPFATSRPRGRRWCPQLRRPREPRAGRPFPTRARAKHTTTMW